jgi:phosphatidylglycerophosphate synthase
VATTNDQWALAFWLLFAAYSTDFLDGLAAKKLQAQTRLGALLDRYADFSLSGLGILGLVVADLLPWWVLLASPALAGFLAYDRFFIMPGKKIHQIRALLSVSYLISVWIALAWAYLTQAFGWSWGYVLITFGILLIAASLKRHRLRAWAGLPLRGH